MKGQLIATHRSSYLENIYNFHHRRDQLRAMLSQPSCRTSEVAFYCGALNRLQRTHVESIRPSDLVVSLRIGDFVYKPNADDKWKQCVYSRFLGFSYFQRVIEQVRFDRLFITSDEPFHALTAEFDRFDPIRVRNDEPLKTLALVSQFGRVAISESTFSWWAAYLSNADEVYFPISVNGLWGVNQVWDKSASAWRPRNPLNVRDADLYLRVDEERYKYFDQASGIIYSYADAPGKRAESDFESFNI